MKDHSRACFETDCMYPAQFPHHHLPSPDFDTRLRMLTKLQERTAHEIRWEDFAISQARQMQRIVRDPRNDPFPCCHALSSCSHGRSGILFFGRALPRSYSRRLRVSSSSEPSSLLPALCRNAIGLGIALDFGDIGQPWKAKLHRLFEFCRRLVRDWLEKRNPWLHNCVFSLLPWNWKVGWQSHLPIGPDGSVSKPWYRYLSGSGAALGTAQKPQKTFAYGRKKNAKRFELWQKSREGLAKVVMFAEE